MGEAGGDAAARRQPSRELGQQGMAGHLAKRSVRLAGHATSIALEPEFWVVLEGAAMRRGIPLAALIADQDAERAGAEEPLASRLRVFALKVASGEA